MQQTNIIVNLQVEGIHGWPNVPQELRKEVGYLAAQHRHVFKIECKVEVTHSDRDIEIIQFKHKILGFLYENFWNTDVLMHDFANKSCEMIAEILCEKFKLNYCKVLEDGENGAEVIVDKFLDEVQLKQVSNSLESMPSTSTAGSNITFVCSYLCGGKTTIAEKLCAGDYTLVHIEVSDIVRDLLEKPNGDRGELQGHPELDKEIIEQIMQQTANSSEFFIVSGVRQPSIIQAFPFATAMWIDTPVDQRFARFIKKTNLHDNQLSREGFEIANRRDIELGIDQVKHMIYQTTAI